MGHALELVFDLGSPFSYLASTRVEALAGKHGAPLQLTPVVLGGIFKATGVAQVPGAARLKHNGLDADRWAKRYGVRLSWPPFFPARTILGQRVLTAIEDGPLRAKAMNALFSAYWADSRDISVPDIVKATLDGAGFDGAALIARTEEPAVKDALRAATDGAIARGVFGVPTLFVGEQMFFGNDRLDFVDEALRG